MRILSLYDGMACGMIAMLGSGVKIDRYVAYEIDKYAVKTATHNFPMIEEMGDVFKAGFTQYEGVDFLVGGSPCTYWSIAQTKNRETEASGLGWELFSQYVRALHEAKPKYFIYENNKSMSKAIRDSIREAFGFEEICINSSLVSAQNRQRYYWVGKRNPDGTYSKVDVKQPEDRGILLKDVLDGAGAKELTERELNYMVSSTHGKFSDRWAFTQKPGQKDKAECIVANIAKGIPYNVCCEPIRVGTWPNDSKNQSFDSKQYRIYDTDGKSTTLRGQGGGMGAKTGLYAVPVFEEADYNVIPGCNVYVSNGKIRQGDINGTKQGKYVYTEATQKTNTLTAGQLHNEKVLTRISYATPCEWDKNGIPTKAISGADGKTYTVYPVADGKITIKEKTYPIKLGDGYYIIRKLTVSECKRLQTVPEWYDFSCVSNTQAYKMLGNGWTCEVIIHLIRSCLEVNNEKD